MVWHLRFKTQFSGDWTVTVEADTEDEAHERGIIQLRQKLPHLVDSLYEVLDPDPRKK